MADGQKSLARVVVPAVMAGLVVALGFILFGGKQTATPAPAANATVSEPGKATGGAGGTAGAASPSIGAGATPGFTGPLAAKMVATPKWDALGGLSADNAKSSLMYLSFYPKGAGVEALALSRHHQGVEPQSPNEVLQQTHVHDTQTLVPFALVSVSINGQEVRLTGGAVETATQRVVESCWTQVSPGVFVAEIVDAAGAPVARITRTYKLVEHVYEFTLEQTFENLTGTPLDVRFVQTGPVELPIGVIRYGGDPRRVRMGLIDANGVDVAGRTPVLSRPDVLGAIAKPVAPVWPIEAYAQEHKTLAWIGTANRFFAVTAHALPDAKAGEAGKVADKRLHAFESTQRVVLTRNPDEDGHLEANAVVALQGASPQVSVPANGVHRTGFGVYAGPIDRDQLAAADTSDGGVSLTDLEIYFWPGPCSFCTFQPVAHLLRWVLWIFAEYVVHDWALAIILLVVCVRTVLHPITKWSQTSLQRFGKQMQKVAPKQKALQEKFKDDPKRLREEMSALMKEENVNYAGALGCLPMFLQTPIWIALSSLMFFLFDLRHTPAFFGVVQQLTGGQWQFLADLAEPDRFIPLGTSFKIPLLSGMMGAIDGINILPVILGLVFFVQQKYLTPPSTAQMSPEMETQQKIMKVVIVFLFPIMMYNAPSGLAIYFITNSALGIVESRHIRKHFEKQEAEREEILKRNPHAFSRKGKEGFFTRMQTKIAEAQARAEQVKKQQEQNKKNRRP